MDQKNLDKLKADLEQLEIDFHQLTQDFKLEQFKEELKDYRLKLGVEDIWQRQPKAARQWQLQQNKLEAKLKAWLQLETDISDLKQLLSLANHQSSDRFDLESLLADCRRQQQILEKITTQKPYDDKPAIMTILAGAGGVDAQDWTAMLLRMYSRWAKRQAIEIELLSQSAGETAGLKSVSLLFKKDGAYGLLREEQGVHRLVRQSPFNAQNLRQTSFARVEVIPSLKAAKTLDIKDSHLKFDFFKSSGAGGQSVNTTDSAVRVTHLPTKITVSVQNERSQSQNKTIALNILRAKLLQLQLVTQNQNLDKLRGEVLPNQWSSQIRSYVLHPYKQVKDLRSRQTTTDVDKVLDGDLHLFLQ